jgi:hypothetical protein
MGSQQSFPVFGTPIAGSQLPGPAWLTFFRQLGRLLVAKTTIGNVPSFADTLGTLQDSGYSPSSFMPAKPVLAAYNTSAGQSIPNGSSFVVVNFDGKIYDTANAVTTGASWAFTSPVSGYYRVTAHITYNAGVWGAVGNRFRIGVLVNGLEYDRFTVAAATTTSYLIGLAGSVTVCLPAGQTVSVATYHDEAAATALTGTATTSQNQIFIEQVSG